VRQRRTVRELQRRYDAAMDAQAFFHAKTAEMRLRHAKYEFTPFSLEPNVKESPGALRDLQVILWVAKAAGLASSWGQLAMRGLITREEARQLMEKERAFKDIRIRLHLHTKRREDRLVFDVQTAIAETFGLEGTPERARQRIPDAALLLGRQGGDPAEHHPAAEHRGQLFPHAVAAGADQPALQRGRRLHRHRRRRHLRQNPAAVLEIFVIMTERPDIKGMTARTMRALWHARTLIDDAFRADRAIAPCSCASCRRRWAWCTRCGA
jgi:[protein-PII] uridylyltransferase